MICVDASIGAKWILEEEHSGKAIALADACRKQRARIVAPPLMPVEVTNVIRQRMRGAGLALADAEAALGRFLAFGVSLRPTTPAGQYTLHHTALRIAAEYDLPAVYDAHYLALATMLDCAFWTDDRRLLQRLNGKLDFVRWIGDYQPQR